EKLAVLAVGGAEAVLVVVGLVVGGAGIEAAVVALLQLDRMRAGQLGLAEHLARLLDAALVIVSNLGDHIARGVIADLVLPDSHCARCSCQFKLPWSRVPVGPGYV